MSHIKDFDPYLKKIGNPLKDCEHDLMDKLKKKNSQWQVEDGSEGAESQRSVIVFLDLNLKWPHIRPEAHPPWPQFSVLGWTLDPRATIGSSDRAVSLLFSPQRC